jgi:23S rRNA pseudouridine1911/1915/1917 synthase
MTEKKIQLVTSPEEASSRLDHFIMTALDADFSRSYVQKLVKQGAVTVNGDTTRNNYILKAGDRIDIEIPEPEKSSIEAKDIPLNIVYEDEHLAVINKQPGMTVHPGSGTHDDTLVNALLFHLNDLSSIGGVERPGIVHRLDRDTAGLMVIAKNDSAHRSLSEQFSSRTVQKEYVAIVLGKPKTDHLVIDKPIGRHPVYRHKMTVLPTGREAKTECFLEKIWNTPKGIYSRLRVIIHTGRTHQIRVHLSSEGIPIVDDAVYSKHKSNRPFLMLASVRLSFEHPASSERMEFSIELPEHMQQFIDKLNAEG